EIAAACDIRIAAPGSIFGVTAAKLGLVYPPGPTRRLAQVLGDSWARYLLVTASIVKFEQMDELGFFHEVSDSPRAAAQELGERIVGLSPLSQIGAKEILDGRLTGQGTGPADAGADGGVPPIRSRSPAVRRRPSPSALRSSPSPSPRGTTAADPEHRDRRRAVRRSSGRCVRRSMGRTIPGESVDRARERDKLTECA